MRVQEKDAAAGERPPETYLDFILREYREGFVARAVFLALQNVPIDAAHTPSTVLRKDPGATVLPEDHSEIGHPA